MKWNVIKNFAPNVDGHIKLIKALSHENTVFYVRKENLEFEELDEKQKNEIMEENYELFKEGLLFFHDENMEDIIKLRIIERLKQIRKFANITYENLNCIFKLVEEEYMQCKSWIKEAIMDVVLEEQKKSSFLNQDNYAFKTEYNESYKYYISKGKLENEKKYFEWHKIEDTKELKTFIEENLFNYNIILTQNSNYDIQYEYYINYYEGAEYILAVKDYKGNFNYIFSNTFGDMNLKI